MKPYSKTWQKRGLAYQPRTLVKYITAQRCLQEVLEEPRYLADAPQDLYRLMTRFGFVWEQSSGFWRLRVGRKAPRTLEEVLGR